MVELGHEFGFAPDHLAKDLRVRWLQHEGKWLLNVDVLSPVPGRSSEQIQQVLVRVAREAREQAVVDRHRNMQTRFHG
jgi:hypothetical protein